jgi:hypothetical protein
MHNPEITHGDNVLSTSQTRFLSRLKVKESASKLTCACALLTSRLVASGGLIIVASHAMFVRRRMSSFVTTTGINSGVTSLTPPFLAGPCSRLIRGIFLSTSVNMCSRDTQVTHQAFRCMFTCGLHLSAVLAMRLKPLSEGRARILKSRS